ncbi:MAG: M28 family metallopeptidase [Candidatus Thorarchaeota archaeon]
MIDDKLKNYMYNFIEEVCNDIGPRESGTEAEILAGNKIEDELKTFCDETCQEEYISSPHAFLGGIRYGALLVLVAVILYWMSLLIDLNVLQIEPYFNTFFLIIAIILIIISVSYFILETMKYYETFDFMFPKRKSKNIIGTINPSSGTIKATIIFSAHHDSAFEFNTFYYLKRFGQIIINVGYLAVILILIGIIIKLIFFLLSINLTIFFFSVGILYLCFTPITIPYILFHSYKPVLGAYDNLSGVSVVLGIGKFLFYNKESMPKHTRVHLISFAGEEAGLRGAKRYVLQHHIELIDNETIVVNLDSIGKREIIIIHNKESGIGAKHDPKIYQEILRIAKNLNPNAKILPLPFGATDAAAFSKKGISATSIGSLNLKEELAPYYHTRNDTPEIIDKEALGQFLEICLNYLKHIDENKENS